MHLKPHVIFGCFLPALALYACGASGTDPPPPQTQVNPAMNVLQLAVGTANIYGDVPSVNVVGLNVVATYRQPAGAAKPGDSGTAVNSPTLTLPNTLSNRPGSPGLGDVTSTILTGPATGEVGSRSMTSTSQSVGASAVTTFGVSGDVVGLGIEPFNYTVTGTPFAVAPYPVPIYDTISADPNQLAAAWGGPPAFDLLGNGQSPLGSTIVPAGTAGVSLGLDVFAGVSAVGGGTYTLKVSVPAGTGTTTQMQSFTLRSLHTLPAFTAPLPVLDANNDGGATLAVTLPSGVTEAYAEIVDSGPVQPSTGGAVTGCNGATAAAPIYYTIEVARSGMATLPAAAAPGGGPSICSAQLNATVNGNPANAPGDLFSVQGIGFDYPLYEASYPKSLGNPSPNILGASGSDDVTISSARVSEQLTPGGALSRTIRPSQSRVRVN